MIKKWFQTLALFSSLATSAMAIAQSAAVFGSSRFDQARFGATDANAVPAMSVGTLILMSAALVALAFAFNLKPNKRES